MFEVAIDTDLCKRDGLCAKTCMRGISQQESKGAIPTLVGAEHCYGCGQCVAICPGDAIKHSGFPEGSVTPVHSELLPSYDQMLELMRSRRSKRWFRQRPVEKAVIEQILEAARFAPSGHNEQTTEFVVVRDEDVLHQIGEQTANGIRKTAQPFQYSIGRLIMRMMMGRRNADYLGELAPELDGLAELYDSGTDWILREAPLLILFCADSAAEYFGRVNANLALHNAALAAETLGLGCFYTGFVVLAAERNQRIAEIISLPETHKIYGALAMGYPRLHFKKWPERNPPKIAWVGNGAS